MLSVTVAKLVHGSWNDSSFWGGIGESATVLALLLGFVLDVRCKEALVVKHIAQPNDFSIFLSSAMIKEAVEVGCGAVGSERRATSASARSAQ